MEEEIQEQLNKQGELLEKIYTSTEKTRKYFLWVFIISVVLVILPLIGMLLVVPAFMNTYLSSFKGLGGL